MRERGPVEPVRGHRVERVGDEDDAGADRDLLAAEAVRDNPRRPSARGGAAPIRRSARRRGSRASGGRSADGARARAARRSVRGRRLAQDLLRDRELAEVVQAAGEADQLDLVRAQAEALGDLARRAAATRSEWLPVYASRESTARARDAAARKRAARSTPLATFLNSDSSATSERASRTWFLPCSFAQ